MRTLWLSNVSVMVMMVVVMMMVQVTGDNDEIQGKLKPQNPAPIPNNHRLLSLIPLA